MATYYTYNPVEKRMEIVVEDILILSFPHDDEETGNTYLTYNINEDRTEYWSGGVVVRSFY